MEGFELWSKARHLSPHTIRDYNRTLKKFLEYVGNVSVNTIESGDVAEFLAAQPFSAKTVLNYHIGLSAFWTWLVNEKYAKEHIVRRVPKPKPQQVVIEPFSEVELKAMLESAGRLKDRNRSIILLLLDTGLRASELCGLQREDIDLVNRRIKVMGKGNKERLIPFSQRTASALFRFLSKEGNKPFAMTRTSLAKLTNSIGKRASVNKAHPHRFRHTFAVQYLRNGGDPYTLQSILGHSTFEMVRHYLALSQVDLDTAHKRASPVENWKL